VNGVLDASMTLAWVFTRSDTAEATLAHQALRNLPSDSWIVPTIWNSEVANGLLRGERAGLIASAQSEFFLDRLSQSPIENDPEPMQQRLPVVLQLARAHGLTAYDAAYLELALRTGRTLATFDQKLAAAARKAGGRVFGDAP
jgi:predicted nucleic acid-binding protein